MTRRMLNAMLGLVAGMLVAPFAAVTFPIFAAWWLYNETDEDCGLGRP